MKYILCIPLCIKGCFIFCLINALKIVTVSWNRSTEHVITSSIPEFSKTEMKHWLEIQSSLWKDVAIRPNCQAMQSIIFNLWTLPFLKKCKGCNCIWLKWKTGHQQYTIMHFLRSPLAALNLANSCRGMNFREYNAKSFIPLSEWGFKFQYKEILVETSVQYILNYSKVKLNWVNI